MGTSEKRGPSQSAPEHSVADLIAPFAVQVEALLPSNVPAPTSFTRFAHHTSDLLARNPHLRPVLGQVVRTLAHRSKLGVLFQR